VAQYIKQGDIFGRVGTGIGKGLAEQLPKEVERGRLAAGLENLGQEQNLTPFQQFSKLSAIPGVTPQMIQSGSELLRQQARGKALADFQSQSGQSKPSPFPATQPGTQDDRSKVPSITKGDLLEQLQEGYIPPTIEERDQIAGEAYNQNPGFFNNDPEKAIAWADSKIAQEEKRFLAAESQNERLSGIQKNVVGRLKDQSDRLNTQVPAELYSRIEDEAVQAAKPRSEGGRGLSEQQVMKEYGDKLNDASRDFAKIDEIGNWGVTLRPAQSTLRSLKELQNKMEKLGETDNFAKDLISKTQVSPQLAYAIAQPISKVEGLSNVIKNLPSLDVVETIAESKVSPQVSVPKTLEIAPKLAKFVKENEKASPLAIAYELQKKGYDADTWLQYITDKAPQLNLRQRQSEQAATPINVVSPWNDWWLSSFSGIE
jgi:hypothetical protein